MNLTDEQVRTIVREAKSYLGHKYRPGFKCIDYVRKVYQTAGINIGILGPNSPPAELNIEKEKLQSPPTGSLIFLRNKTEKRERAWSHLVIVLSNDECIHCSLFIGEVVTSSFEEIFRKYEFAPSL
ncbi:MAG TPA: NlpC/P60 family protein [Candidatus Paceibacterota bacterium]